MQSWAILKSQAPNPKLQRIPNIQIPSQIPKANAFGNREFAWGFWRWECVGIWSLELGI